ncbi:holin [Fusobacterium necrophorum subsp. funduliforme]|uniref:phage holin family protein n=1 Tax=Fusobacterium necrophorum TaxID=859 RepID=UPI000788A506|nr:phage holin family protein [Fusobacterium necrophorum]KYM48159.1 holin [Fusobacterium necrophorum subsp. funduliforme]
MIGLTKAYLALCWTGWIGFLVWLIGGFDLLAKVLLTLMFLDYLTGLWVGYRQKNLNSKRAYKGLQKKFLILVLLCGASLMHKLVPGIGFRSLVGLFYCATEMLSIIENCAKCGVPIPKKLKKALEQVRDK